ncbi:MAG: hypothetical protein R3B72_06760 [Polyangiaceae bacterium]
MPVAIDALRVDGGGEGPEIDGVAEDLPHRASEHQAVGLRPEALLRHLVLALVIGLDEEEGFVGALVERGACWVLDICSVFEECSTHDEPCAIHPPRWSR